MNTTPSPLPPGVARWSWGAFFLSWIWAIGNRTWIGLLSLVPVVGLIMVIILGIKGREWAWKNKSWRDVDHFNHVQHLWSVWGVAVGVTVGVIMFFGLLAAIIIPALVKMPSSGM